MQERRQKVAGFCSFVPKGAFELYVSRCARFAFSTNSDILAGKLAAIDIVCVSPFRQDSSRHLPMALGAICPHKMDAAPLGLQIYTA
jgi:hypothetical protein